MENVAEIKLEEVKIPPVESHSSVTIVAKGPVETNKKVTKVIVAVHGVGDQNAYGTIQQVVNQFCTFYKEPPAVPLGMFHTGAGQAAFSMPSPFPPKHFDQLAFAEVYWAKIPREVVTDQHTLEGTQAWAATIVERLRLRFKLKDNPSDFKDVDFDRVKAVLLEMIQTITILERLCFLADRAGLFTFDLKKLLDDYLGDVQIVAEFEPSRRKILDMFDEVMCKVHKAYPEADIYVIAHSEGTVVSLLGILEKANKISTFSWLNNVRGLMTFGSPIDKHLILWPEIFPDCLSPDKYTQRKPIQWRNYYDKGDPIGFELDDARTWLKKKNWDGLFDFTKEDDMGFIRYPFPGKAHVDYWNDPAVFGHFIKTVVNPSFEKKPTFPKPADKQLNKILSYTLPYVGVFTLLFVAVYILFKVVFSLKPNALMLNTDEFVIRNVAASTLLLSGILVISRIPRLTHAIRYQIYAICFFAFATIMYTIIVPKPLSIEDWVLGHSLFLKGYINSGLLHLVLTRLTIVSILVSFLYLRHLFAPKSGIELFLILGTVVIITIVYFYNKNIAPENSKPLWPITLATAAFFYLCWLSALIFDLVFVWHVHIRTSFALTRMKAMSSR